MATLTKQLCWLGAVVVLGATVTCGSLADQVVMQNGDQYHGKVLSVTTTNVVLQSELLGVVNLTRSKVVKVALESKGATNSAPADVALKTNPPVDLSAAVRQLGSQSNLMQQVRAQFLTAAGPETNEKFTQMINDLTTGKMSVENLRAQAKAAADQLRMLEKDAGDDVSGASGLYLSILDGFLAETEMPSAKVATNAPAPAKP